MNKNEEQTRSLFGISLTDRPKWQQFLICSSGFFFGYLVNGVCEEYVYNRLQFSYGWYFTFVQGFVYLVLIYLQGFTTKQMMNPWKTYVKLSAVLMGSHGLTKGSLAFLNYPAQLMFKSTKVLPVMVMGAFIPGLRRKYPAHEYVSALLLVVGLILFTLADAQTSPNFSMIGVIMISGALIMDSFLGNLQEAIFTMNPETTQMEMLFCSTVVGLPMLIPPMLLTGELFKAWNSCSQHLYVYGVLVFEAMATFIGQVSVLSLIALFGAATTAMVTTARKAVTLLLSYLIFTKPLTEQHGTGLLLIAMGITLKLLPADDKPIKRTATSSFKVNIWKLSSSEREEADEEKRAPVGLASYPKFTKELWAPVFVSLKVIDINHQAEDYAKLAREIYRLDFFVIVCHYYWAAAPEVVNFGDDYYSCKSDIWLIGITALQLACGGLPVSRRQDLDVMTKMLMKQPKSTSLQVAPNADTTHGTRKLSKTLLEYGQNMFSSRSSKETNCRPAAEAQVLQEMWHFR
ncbi:hypothetical protein WN944_017609 [Citrus x changshan-huyou]|uniref:Uncharacterized protein n=1 Tax=Citrus x changshan-huyou TaxID=2935761 RepID=A0AAP0QPQ3_9ROSI